MRKSALASNWLTVATACITSSWNASPGIFAAAALEAALAKLANSGTAPGALTDDGPPGSAGGETCSSTRTYRATTGANDIVASGKLCPNPAPPIGVSATRVQAAPSALAYTVATTEPAVVAEAATVMPWKRSGPGKRSSTQVFPSCDVTV